jgi:hypothetical protein
MRRMEVDETSMNWIGYDLTERLEELDGFDR